MKKVLFICTANICRSPMAEAVFDVAAEDAGIPFRAHSAGTAALVGEPAAPKAVTALEELGVYPAAHRARQVDPDMLAGSELVLAMTPQHLDALRSMAGGGDSEKLHTLIEYATGTPSQQGIPDPYGQAMIAYQSSVRQISEYVDGVVTRLVEAYGPARGQGLRA